MPDPSRNPYPGPRPFQHENKSDHLSGVQEARSGPELTSRVAGDGTAVRDPAHNPYVGARPFEREDRPYFFGRDEEARQLTSLVIAHRVVLFYAPSGAGKTSLLKARVIADLESRRVRVLPVSRVGGDLPRDLDGSRVTNIYVFNTLVSLAGKDARPGELADLRLEEGLRPYVEQAPDEERLHPRLLILDQFEELFTTHPGRLADRADFFLQLQECLGAYPHLSLLITMREDYIANLDFYAAQVPDRLRTRFRMELLSREGALDAVMEPAREAGCPFADGVAETLVDNLRRLQPGRDREGGPAAAAALGAYVEPVHLQIVCRQLWAKLPPEREVIELQDVHTFGDVDEALKGFYEDALKKVFEKVPVGQRRVRLWFDRSLITPARTRNLVYRGDAETAGLPNAAVLVLYDEYIIRPVARGNDVWYELAHDRLVEPILEANRRWRAERPDARQPSTSAPPVSGGVAEGPRIAPAPAEAAQTLSVPYSPVKPSNPYVGIRPFERGERLYGREREANALLDLLINERVVLLYSPTGVGKSSFINAAILPELEHEGFRLLGPVRVGADMPTEALAEVPGARVPNRYVSSVLLGLESSRDAGEQIPEDVLARMSLPDYLSRYPGRPAGCQGDAWVFDQLEELVTLDPVDFEGKAEFFKQVGHVLNAPDQWALFSLREEFIAGLDPYLQFIPGGLSTRFRLEPLNADTAREYIARPAADVGVVFADDALKMLVDELRTVRIRRQDGSTVLRLSPYLDPVQLQLVCVRLWETLPPGRKVIDVEDVHALGDLDATLGRYYEYAVERASQNTGVSERAIRNWIDRQLITETGERGRVLRGVEETQGLHNHAVTELLNAHLLRAEAVGGVLWYELVNNRMIEPVRASNRAWFEAHLNALQRQAVLWEREGRPSDRLLVGAELAAAEKWASAHGDELEAREREFLDLARRAQTAAERERRQSRLLRLAVGAALLALVFIALTVWALASRGEAQHARQKADAQASRAVAAEQTAVGAREDADRLQATLAVNVAVLLTVQAASTPATQTVLVATPSPSLLLTPTVDQAATVQAVQAQLLGIQATQTVIASGIAAQVLPPTPAASPTPASTVAPSPTPKPTQPALAVGPPRGRIMFVSNRNSPRDLYVMDPDGNNPQQWTVSLAQEPSYSPGQRLLAFTKLRVGSMPESIYVKPLDGGKERLVTKPDDWDYWEPSIAPDGKLIASSSSHNNVNSEIFVVDLNGSIIRQLTTWNPAKSEIPAWSPDGQTIAFVSDREGNKEIYLMKADGSGDPIPLTRNPAEDTDPAWSPDSRSIAFISDRDGNRDVWVMDANGSNQRYLTRSPESERYPAWSLDGNWLAFTRYMRDMQDQEVFLMRVESTLGSERNLTQNQTPNPVEDFQPVWVP